MTLLCAGLETAAALQAKEPGSPMTYACLHPWATCWKAGTVWGAPNGRGGQPGFSSHKLRLWRRQTRADAESLWPRQCLMRVCARQGPCLSSGGCFP